MAATQTVHDRIDIASSSLTPPQLGLGLAVLAIAAFALLFVQDPMVHDALHNFRHAAGITCH
ncbi:MAG: CbtB domain-containing protein [Haloarculaceae archaeon]